MHTPVRRQAPTEEIELRDLLDRILDKGLFLGSATMLVLGETSLADPLNRLSLGSLQTGGGVPIREPSGSRLNRRRRK